MHLKQNGYYLGVLLIYTITTITLPSVGWCEHHDRSSDLTTKSPVYQDRKRPHLPSRRQREKRTSRVFVGVQSGRRLAHSMAELKEQNKRKQSEVEWMSSSLNPPREACGAGNIKRVINGKFYIRGQFQTNLPNVGYQSDSAVPVPAQGGQARIRAQRLSGSEESWQKLQPVVECADDTMTLTVRKRRAVQLLLDRVNESSVALSQLPPQCGYSVQSTWRDLSLMAQYDACHVKQEAGSYVLPLLWRGTPVRMSCPVSDVQPQAAGPSTLCCFPYGMTVKVQGLSATEDLKVKVRGEWNSLLMLAEQCGYTLERQDAEILIAAPFIACGITVMDGKYTLSLQVAEKAFTLTCPVSSPEELSLTHQPLVHSPHLTRQLSEPMPETLEPFLWAPPFYLAPPYYPHPTAHHKYPGPAVHDVYNSPTSSTPDPTFGLQPIPPVDVQPDYQDSHQIPVRESYKHFDVRSSRSSSNEMEDSRKAYSDVHGLSEERSATAAGFLMQTEASSLQPPSHAFNPYYHYYHHPKIPLPGPPEDPDPGPEVPPELSLPNSNNPGFPVLPPNVQQSEALRRVNSDQSLQPLPKAASAPYIPAGSTAPHAPYPPQPYPYHYYFPHIARGEAKKMPLLSPTTATKTNVLNPSVYPPPHSSVLQAHEKNYLKPDIEQPSSDKTIDLQRHMLHLLFSEEPDDKKSRSAPETPAVHPPLPAIPRPGPDPVVVPLHEQASPRTLSSNHNSPIYPYYYHPYYGYYQMYYRPESLLGADGRKSAASFKETTEPQLPETSSPPEHPPYCKHPPSQQTTTTPPTESTSDDQNGPVSPHYHYYHLHYQPKRSVDNQDPGKSMMSEKQSSESDYSRMDWQAHSAATGYSSMPQPLHSPFHIPYSHYITEQHPHDPLEHLGGEEAEDGQDDERREDQLSYTPSASPCGLGSASDLDCSFSLGCCSYPVKDCTVGKHFVFALPDSVVEPTVAPPAQPSEVSNVSCTLQRLTSDPDLYIVPLDGCGVSKHVFGQTVLHLLEVQGLHSLKQDHSSVQESTPVRLMVGCSSSPDSPGEVRFHVMDQSPPVQSTPATVTVHLRIATDESFSTYHPETHLPLSLMRGRLVYLEVSLLDPPEPNLVLLVHSCVAYTGAPYASWMLVYDGCRSRGDSQLLPFPRAHPHIRRILITSFLSLTSESPLYTATGEYAHLEDPEIYFLCVTEVCSAADGDCAVNCINGPNSDVSN